MRHSNLYDLNSFKSHHLSEILVSCATLNQEHSVLFQKIGDSLVASLGPGTRKLPLCDLVNTLWAFTKLNEPQPILSAKIANAIFGLSTRNILTSEELATIAWAYATPYERNDSSWETTNVCSRWLEILWHFAIWRNATLHLWPMHSGLTRQLA